MVIHIHRAGYFSLSRASYGDVNQSVTCNAMQVMLREKCCIECDPEARDNGMWRIMVPAQVFVLREVSNIIKSNLTKTSLGTAHRVLLSSSCGSTFADRRYQSAASDMAEYSRRGPRSI